LVKLKKNTSDQHWSEVCMILNCVGLTQSMSYRSFIALLVWSIFFIYLNFCYYR